MTAPISPLLSAALAPPVMEARRWIDGKTFPPDRPLLNLSQAAPVDPPPESLRRAIADAALDRPDAHLYGPVLGDPELRAEIAARWSDAYAGAVAPADVAVTSGCNQAFCAALATLADPGEAVILPTPWYFNHRMWLDMAGVRTDPLPCSEAGLPDSEEAERLIRPETRALVLVTPNNPTGAEYPPSLIDAFFDLCARRGIALVLDETYRDFRSAEGPAHGLFARPDWRQTLVHLYSFSKVFRLTGHRVGALIAGPERLAAAEKFLDTVTICPGRLGQIAALAGLRGLGNWVAEERREILSRRAAIEAGFAEVALLRGLFRLRGAPVRRAVRRGGEGAGRRAVAADAAGNHVRPAGGGRRRRPRRAGPAHRLRERRRRGDRGDAAPPPRLRGLTERPGVRAPLAARRGRP